MPRSKKDAAGKRKSAVRKPRAEVKGKARAEAKAKAKAEKVSRKSVNSAGSNRAEGIRLFKLAGRPTKEQFIQVYGERGPKMTWEQRAAAGVPAEKFQAALASAVRARK